ncbi:hypothetical protein PG991_003650 [Apiospora marii]|uniref:Inner centromere protein ARK-binding domain-containing protein n=1 Tax=Apiospora marii TaxID=335849 RepID=A0ABR1S5R8_9PEZI
MEYEKEPVCHFNRPVIRAQKKRGLSRDRYEEGTFVPSKRRALSEEEAPLPLEQDRGRRRGLSSSNDNNNVSDPRLYSALQSRDAAGQQPDAIVGSHCSSSTPGPAITKPGDDSQAEVPSSSALPDQRVEMSSPSLTKTMGTHGLSAHRSVDEAPPPPHQIDTVGKPDVGNPPVDVSLPQSHHSDTQLETMNPGEQRADVVGPPFNAPLPPPSPQYHYNVAREPSQDRATSAFRALLRPSPSPSTQRSDIQLQPPGTSIRDSLTRGHQQRRPSSSSSRGSTSRLLQHTVPKPEAPKSRLPLMGTFRAPPALRPAKDRELGQLSARNGVLDKAGSIGKGVSARKGLPTLRQNEEESGVYTKGKTIATPKKRRQSQLFPPDGKEAQESAPQKEKAPKRQRREDKSKDKVPDAMQVDVTDDQPVYQKRQRGRWAAINTVCLEQLDEDENVDRVAAAVPTSQGQFNNDDDGLEDDNDNDDNTTHESQQKQKTQEEQEDQFYHDHAQRTTRDYGRARTIITPSTSPKKHTRNSPSRSRNSGDKGAVWTAFVDPLVREDKKHNLQLKERLQQRRRAREEQAEAQRREEVLEEKRRVTREKARERRQRKKEEKQKERENEEVEMREDQPAVDDGVEEGASCSPDWLRLDQGAS